MEVGQMREATYEVQRLSFMRCDVLENAQGVCVRLCDVMGFLD